MLTFHPFSRIKIFLDIIHLGMLTFYFFEIPLIMAFNSTPKFPLSIIFLLILKIINLNTGYFRNGQLIKNRKNIFIHHFKKYSMNTIFFVTSIIPIFYYNIKLKGWHKIIYFLFYFQILIAKKLFENILIKFKFKKINVSKIELGLLFFKLSLIVHIFACWWFFCTSDEILPIRYINEKKTWIFFFKIENETNLIHYLYSLYWAITTMLTGNFINFIKFKNKSWIW